MFGNILKILFSTTTHTKPTTIQQKNHQNTTTHTTTTTTKIKITQRERSVRGFPAKLKALGRRRSQRLVGRRLWVEDWWVKGSGSGSKALDSWRDLGFGFAGEVEDWFMGSWREGSGSPAMGSLSLSLFVRERNLTLTLRFPENEI